MIKNNVSVSAVKEKIKSFMGKNVEVNVNLGRNKFVSYDGVLTAVYPALFTVAPFDKTFKCKTSFSYSEILCGNVKVKEKRAL